MKEIKKQTQKALEVMADPNKSDKDKLQGVEKILQGFQFPPETYKIAIYFLGIVTTILGIGAVSLGFRSVTIPDGLWAVLGAGIGGLAGIFTGQAST